MKKCEVNCNGKKYTGDFYGIFQFSSVVDPSIMVRGHAAGVIAYPVAVVDFDNGIGLINIPIEDITRVYEVKNENYTLL